MVFLETVKRHAQVALAEERLLLRPGAVYDAAARGVPVRHVEHYGTITLLDQLSRDFYAVVVHCIDNGAFCFGNRIHPWGIVVEDASVPGVGHLRHNDALPRRCLIPPPLADFHRLLVYLAVLRLPRGDFRIIVTAHLMPLFLFLFRRYELKSKNSSPESTPRLATEKP